MITAKIIIAFLVGVAMGNISFKIIDDISLERFAKTAIEMDEKKQTNKRKSKKYKYQKPNIDTKKLGRKYVYYSKPNRKYQVKFRRNNNIIYLGSFDTIEQAMNARDKWLKENDM